MQLLYESCCLKPQCNASQAPYPVIAQGMGTQFGATSSSCYVSAGDGKNCRSQGAISSKGYRNQAAIPGGSCSHKAAHRPQGAFIGEAGRGCHQCCNLPTRRLGITAQCAREATPGAFCPLLTERLFYFANTLHAYGVVEASSIRLLRECKRLLSHCLKHARIYCARASSPRALSTPRQCVTGFACTPSVLRPAELDCSNPETGQRQSDLSPCPSSRLGPVLPRRPCVS